MVHCHWHARGFTEGWGQKRDVRSTFACIIPSWATVSHNVPRAGALHTHSTRVGHWGADASVAATSRSMTAAASSIKHRHRNAMKSGSFQ